MRSGRRSVGIRMARSSPKAKDIAIEVRGNTASLARQRFHIDHVPANMAPKGQVKGVAESLKWSCDIINVAYDNLEQSHYAIAKADAPSPEHVREGRYSSTAVGGHSAD
eukprot:7764536-Pyramimonas_sp.AAC.1